MAAPAPSGPTKAGAAAPREPVVYDVSIEGLYVKGLAGRLTPSLKSKLKTLGIDLDQKLRPTYSREVWARGLELTVDELFAGLPREEAFRKLGHAVLEGTANTLIGKTILTMAKLIGPRRAIARLPQAFESMNNFVVCRQTERSPNEHELWLSDCYNHPSYMQGGVEAALTATGAKDLVVEQLARENESVTFRVRWK